MHVGLPVPPGEGLDATMGNGCSQLCTAQIEACVLGDATRNTVCVISSIRQARSFNFTQIPDIAVIISGILIRA